MTDKTYEGWKNRATWCTAFSINNDQPLHEAAHAVFRGAYEQAADEWDNADRSEPKRVISRERWARLEASDALKEWAEEAMLPELDDSFASGLLAAAWSEIDWREIGEHFEAAMKDAETPR